MEREMAQPLWKDDIMHTQFCVKNERLILNQYNLRNFMTKNMLYL